MIGVSLFLLIIYTYLLFCISLFITRAARFQLTMDQESKCGFDGDLDKGNEETKERRSEEIPEGLLEMIVS